MGKSRHFAFNFHKLRYRTLASLKRPVYPSLLKAELVTESVQAGGTAIPALGYTLAPYVVPYNLGCTYGVMRQVDEHLSVRATTRTCYT
ncbi:hypothetical protein Zmor_025226 [Zophobas morio]|uniref:Uncharacterized protein n=1 Tax=Zophobas morio TaxID=2755281 RepID=A0AA38HR90_9CUCU|nr:hypothetical protein Zmor_025226 [Zophobas morio]